MQHWVPSPKLEFDHIFIYFIFSYSRFQTNSLFTALLSCGIIIGLHRLIFTELFQHNDMVNQRQQVSHESDTKLCQMF